VGLKASPLPEWQEQCLPGTAARGAFKESGTEQDGRESLQDKCNPKD
jgi:hypothetical protein